MAYPLTFPVAATEQSRILHLGRLDLHTDASVLSTSVGKGITWAKQSTGVYRGTLSAQYTGQAPTNGIPMLIFLQVVKASASKIEVELANQTVSNGYFEIRTVDGDAVGRAAADTAEAISVNVFAVHCNTTNPY